MKKQDMRVVGVVRVMEDEEAMGVVEDVEDVEDEGGMGIAEVIIVRSSEYDFQEIKKKDVFPRLFIQYSGHRLCRLSLFQREPFWAT
jgi:hypothetical protein